MEKWNEMMEKQKKEKKMEYMRRIDGKMEWNDGKNEEKMEYMCRIDGKMEWND